MRNAPKWALLGIIVSTAAGAARAASPLAYVEAAHELDDGRPATSAYNLVDGKPATAWCSKGRPHREEIIFGFKSKQKVTHISVIVGAMRGKELDKRRARPRVLAVTDGSIRREIEIKDTAEPQLIELEPAATANRLLVTVLETRAGATPDAPVCMRELQLRKANRVLTGPEVGKALRGLSTPARRLLHSWVDEPAAPERTLLFSLDGTFTFTYEPLMDGKPVRLKGKWRATKKTVTFEVRGKKTRMKSLLTKLDDGEGQIVTQLRLSGDGPSEAMNFEYQPAPMHYNE